MSRIGLLMMTLAASAVMAAPSSLQAQLSASATLDVDATVIKALTLSKVTAGNLSFGNMAQGASKTILATAGTAIKFQANGQANTSIGVTFTSATLSGGGSTMTFTPSVNGYASDTQGSSSAVTSSSSVTLDATTGNYYLWVGGAITAGAAQAIGAYTGTFTLQVAYTGV